VTPTGRASRCLDGEWEFVPDPEHQFEPDRLPAGVPIEVPGAWEAQLPQPFGIVHGWYRRRFEDPAVPGDGDVDGRRGGADGRLVLRFGSAMARSTIWLDGRRIGENDLGYIPFEVDAGRAPVREHELVVEIENPLNILSEYPAFGGEGLRAASDRLDGGSFDDLPHGKQTWYSSTSGLLGSVVAERTADPRFASIVVHPDPDNELATVRWQLAGPGADAPSTVRLIVTAPSGDEVTRVDADGRAGRATLAIPSPERWDLWTPTFYRLLARVTAGREIGSDPADRAPVDEAKVRFGMRSIAVDGGSILLNGRPIYLRGALDQDFWPDGRSNPPSRTALEVQARLAREMGLNLLRCHIKVPDPAYLEVADEAGLLVWAEVPSWGRFGLATARLARRMLERMVETMGSHPSLIAWSIVNEDWGTDLRHGSRDRRWLRTTVDWLRSIDPGRLVVDNSACETNHGPNFHLRTDLADFHAYRSMPDGASRWRALVDDFAQSPGWLWSPHGDAARTGDEALVLSEFGGWGLPRPSAVGASEARAPWWWSTGQMFRRPAGMLRRFRRQGLDRIWSDADALAEATQWRQFDGLVGQIRELRRHGSIRGYVLTELADAFWEANGLLDVCRAPKAFHDRLAEINAPDVLVVDLPRTDLWGGERLECPVMLSSFPDSAPDTGDGASASDDGALDWTLTLQDGTATTGRTTFRGWPNADAREVARIALEVPEVDAVSRGEVVVRASAAGRGGPVFRQAVVIVPAASRRTARPRRIRVVDPLDLWAIEARLAELGHEIVAAAAAELLVTSRLDRSALEGLDGATGALVLARSTDALAGGFDGMKSVHVRRRRPGDGTQVHERPWDGDWSSVFAWSLPAMMPGLPDGGLLGDAHREVFPDHVLDGLDVASADDGVRVGLFSGWVHSPVALVASLSHGRARAIVTTLRLAPEDGPIATALLEQLIQEAAGPGAGH
jgi:Glycosyl hydrolases family 2, TIM barrel domain